MKPWSLHATWSEMGYEDTIGVDLYCAVASFLSPLPPLPNVVMYFNSYYCFSNYCFSSGQYNLVLPSSHPLSSSFICLYLSASPFWVFFLQSWHIPHFYMCFFLPLSVPSSVSLLSFPLLWCIWAPGIHEKPLSIDNWSWPLLALGPPFYSSVFMKRSFCQSYLSHPPAENTLTHSICLSLANDPPLTFSQSCLHLFHTYDVLLCQRGPYEAGGELMGESWQSQVHFKVGRVGHEYGTSDMNGHQHPWNKHKHDSKKKTKVV